MQRIIVLALLALLVAACGGSEAADSTATSDTAAIAPTAATAATLDAEAVVEALKAAGLPIDRVMVWTAETDPNELLGRPNQYTSKVTFTDTRIDEMDGDNWQVDNGGDIEVFAEASQAKARADYINAIVSSSSLFTQYVYLHDTILLRLGKALTPDQAAAYEAALAELD